MSRFVLPLCASSAADCRDRMAAAVVADQKSPPPAAPLRPFHSAGSIATALEGTAASCRTGLLPPLNALIAAYAVSHGPRPSPQCKVVPPLCLCRCDLLLCACHCAVPGVVVASAPI